MFSLIIIREVLILTLSILTAIGLYFLGWILTCYKHTYIHSAVIRSYVLDGEALKNILLPNYPHTKTHTQTCKLVQMHSRTHARTQWVDGLHLKEKDNDEDASHLVDCEQTGVRGGRRVGTGF